MLHFMGVLASKCPLQWKNVLYNGKMTLKRLCKTSVKLSHKKTPFTDRFSDPKNCIWSFVFVSTFLKICQVIWQLFLLASTMFLDESTDIYATFLVMKCEMMSMGTGKIIVEFFSADIVFSVCKYRSWNYRTKSQFIWYNGS